jgi:hypothetical protein
MFRLYPLDRRLGGPQSRSRHRGEEKNLVRAGNGTLARSQSLYRPSYRDVFSFISLCPIFMWADTDLFCCFLKLALRQAQGRADSRLRTFVRTYPS